MAKLTGRQRNQLSSKKFALPAEKKYPVDTPGRAANAKARAAQQVKKGNLTRSQQQKVNTAANRVLKKGK